MNTRSINFQKVRATNSTSASITAPAPTITAPTGDGVVNVRDSRSEVPNFGELIFHGVGSADTTGTAVVYLWFLVKDLYVPVPILNLDLTLGTAVGVAGSSIGSSDQFVDTLALTGGTANTALYSILSPANNGLAKVAFDLTGASFVEVRTAKGTTTSLNSIFRGF